MAPRTRVLMLMHLLLLLRPAWSLDAAPLLTSVPMETSVAPAGAGHGGWRRSARCTAADLLDLSFLLRRPASATAALEAELLAVSDPASPRYGRYLTRDGVTALAAMPEAVAEVARWLAAAAPAAVVAPGPHRDSVVAQMPCPAAEALFRSPIHHYAHAALPGRTVLRAAERYALPGPVARLVATVAPLLRLPAVRRPIRVPDGAADGLDAWDAGCGGRCRNKVTPAVLARAYELRAAPAEGTARGSFATAEFQGVMWDQAGLDTFGRACGVPNVTVAHQVGPERPLRCHIPPFIGSEVCAEAMLDIEYMKGVGGAVPLTNVFNQQYSLEKWAEQLQAMPDGALPLVHSVSYGNDEAQAPNTPEYMRACDAEFMKVGLRGVSLLVASGDSGVWGREGALAADRFHPDFPASSPYVTAVGGTDFATRSTVGPEAAWRDGGGGFSDTFPAPAWQRAAVAAYLATAALPDAALYNASGRAYPDVAALGGQRNPYCVSVDRVLSGIAGTSASCPVVAAVVARLNEARLGAGRPPMGFLNPFLYAHPGALNDVTLGENKGPGRVGFKAGPGWDPATGLGTPNFPRLRAAAMAAVGAA